MKRIFDFIFSIVLFFILLPLLILISICVYIKMGSPVYFVQTRIGLDEKKINLLKFRTMTNDIDDNGHLLPNEMRVTKLGRILRKTSIDELPSLINVIKGDLSLVGPRPLLVDYLPFYKEKHKLRHTVRPGITGLAQVNGRNLISWEERLDYDSFYATHHNIMLDIKILFKTIFKVLHSEGVEGSEDLSIVRLDKDDDYLGS